MVSLTLGGLTGFFIRDEMYMPTYLKIKMATMQHRKIVRQSLSSDLLSLIDEHHGEERYAIEHDSLNEDH